PVRRLVARGADTWITLQETIARCRWISWNTACVVMRQSIFVRHAIRSVEAHRDAVVAPDVDRRHVEVESARCVDAALRLFPGQPLVGRAADLDVVLAIA